MHLADTFIQNNFKKLLFYCIFYQINAALVSIRHFKHLKTFKEFS